MKDLLNAIDLKVALAPVVVVDNTVQTGNIIDRRGFESLTFAIPTGVLADLDATFAVTMQEGNNSGLSDASSVAASDMVGTLALASFTFADDNKVRKIGYVGTKRYVRIIITPANNTGNAPLAAVAILGHAVVEPTANPPV